MNSECLIHLKDSEERRAYLEKENKGLREVYGNLNLKYDRACDAFEKADRECTKLKTAPADDLKVIGKLRESLTSEGVARRDAEVKVSSLEKKIQDQDEIISKLKSLDVA